MEDVGVPRSPGARTCSGAIEAIATRHDVRIGTFGHAGDGNLHPDSRPRARRPARRKRSTKAVQARSVPGRPRPGRDGDRRARHRLGAARVAGDAARARTRFGVMRAIKNALDPQGLLNPGRVLPLAD